MVKKYDVDEELRRKLIKTQYKKHPLWKRRLWVRVILNIFVVVITIYAGYYTATESYYHYTGMEEFCEIILFSTCFGILASIAPLTYFSQLRYHCLETLIYRLNESVVLTDEEIQEAYLDKDCSNPNMYSGFNIPYKNIKRIIYNEYHQKVSILGKNNRITYTDYYKGEIGVVKENKDRDIVRIFLYFNNNENLLKTISERSGVKIETVSYPEELEYMKSIGKDI